MSKRVDFDQNVQTLGPPNGGHSSSEQSWSSSGASTSTASTSADPLLQRNYPNINNNNNNNNRNVPSPQSQYSANYYNTQPSPTHYSNQIEYYDDDDFDDDSYSLYINESGGYVSRYPPPSQVANSNQQDGGRESHQSTTHHLHPTTLYRSGSVSIVNCEYKLKEKYPHLIYLLFFVVIYILLILLGASLFVLFEAKTELRLRDQIMHTQQLFLEKNECVEPKELKQFVKSIMAANDKGVNLAKLNELIDLAIEKQNETLNASLSYNSTSEVIPEFAQDALQTVEKAMHKSSSDVSSSKNIINKYQYKNGERDEESREELSGVFSGSKADETIQITKHASPIRVPMEMANWEFFSSLTYVSTVVTTIGYGHVSPVTSEGKILTLVFGAIAIPCTLLFFSIIISAIRDGPVKAFEAWLIKFFSKYNEYYHVTLLKIRFLHLILVTLMLFVALILLPAFMFVQLEPDWTFLDSFYYCFITITTVGLGDYVPAQNTLMGMDSRPLYLLGTVMYMYIGLCMIMLWIALVLRIPYFNFKTFLVIEEPEISEEKLNERTRLLSENSTHTYQTIY